MTEWGRREEAGRWIRKRPAWTLSAVLLACVAAYATADYRYSVLWTPLQRSSLSAYAESTTTAMLGLGPRRYVLPVQPVRPDALYDNAAVCEYLREAVYGGQSLLALTGAPLRVAVVVLITGLVIGIPRDRAARRARRHGRRLKGPMLVTAEAFNHEVRGDGLHVQQEGWADIAIPRRAEASHIVILGDTGTGKSSLIRQFLRQIAARGETAVVYDPAREYLPQFFEQDRGDQILNPLDARCPYWTPAHEVLREAEALTLAAALFPSRPNENPFFAEAPRRIFAHLLTLKPSADVLAAWLSNGDELDRLLKGTPYAHMIDANAPAQRSGVLAALNMQADTLSMLPRTGAGDAQWSAAEWARTRRGWLFFTSGPDTRERQIPLMTLWLDLLILRLMHARSTADRKTWLVIDELASLRRLPQLATALTESRKANVPMVIGFQAKSQMEAIYGPVAEAMLSQPATKILLRTSEAKSAKWVSEVVGDVEVERIRESRSRGDKASISDSLDRRVEPLLLPSEIEGLSDRTGYLKSGNLVTPIRFPYLSLPHRTQDFIERDGLTPSPHPSVDVAGAPAEGLAAAPLPLD